jgi:hypothetical protein
MELQRDKVACVHEARYAVEAVRGPGEAQVVTQVEAQKHAATDDGVGHATEVTARRRPR